MPGMNPIGVHPSTQTWNQIGARFGACMWIHTKAAISLRSRDTENFMFKLHSITEAINKTWEFLYVTHEWIQKRSVELQESRIMWFLQDGIEVPCTMQWRLLWYSAQSHLNKVLIRNGALRACHDTTIKKPWRSCSLHSLGKGHTPRSVFLEIQRAIMVKYMQGWTWRLDRDMKGGIRVDDLIC